jgi:ACS family tartrate transporter-like MFS transporter
MDLQESSKDGAASELGRKVRRHLLPPLFIIYVVAYLDRINVGFAALDMDREVGLSSEQYGLLSGIFFWGYFLFEVPSNLMLHRTGARTWIARILLTWGVIAALTGLAQSAQQLYMARFCLGAAEAGCFPGILYYLTYWFPQRQQAQAVGLFLTSLPTASIIGGPLSGWIMDHVHYFGMSGWRWLLILEALPAIACGLLTYLFLPDRPKDAWFLSEDEKRRIEIELGVEAAAKPNGGDLSIWRSLTHPRILHLVAIHFLFLMGLYISGFWMPQSIKDLAQGYSNTVIGLLVMIPSAVSLLTMVMVSRHSDESNERYLHAALPLLIAAVGLYFVGATPSLTSRMILWCVVASGIASYLGPFWACPSELMSGRSAASALAFINSVGSLGSFFALTIIGSIASHNGTPRAGFQAVAVALALAAVLMLAQKLYSRQTAPVSAARLNAR